MNIVVTGAAGFLGQRLIRALLTRGELNGPDGRPHRIERIRGFDVLPLEGIDDTRFEAVSGDISDPAYLETRHQCIHS